MKRSHFTPHCVRDRARCARAQCLGGHCAQLTENSSRNAQEVVE